MRVLLLASVLLLGSFPASAQPAQQPPAEKDIPVPAALAQATVDYLATRPYREVAGIMQHWLRLAQEKKDN